MQQQKEVGAKCPQCPTGKYVQNPKTGKVFCDQKCWLGPGQAGQSTYVSPNMAQGGNSGQIKPTEKADWKKISWGKCKHAFLVEMYKKGEVNESKAEELADMSMRNTKLTETQQKIEKFNEQQHVEETINVDEMPF